MPACSVQPTYHAELVRALYRTRRVRADHAIAREADGSLSRRHVGVPRNALRTERHAPLALTARVCRRSSREVPGEAVTSGAPEPTRYIQLLLLLLTHRYPGKMRCSPNRHTHPHLLPPDLYLCFLVYPWVLVSLLFRLFYPVRFLSHCVLIRGIA